LYFRAVQKNSLASSLLNCPSFEGLEKGGCSFSSLTEWPIQRSRKENEKFVVAQMQLLFYFVAHFLGFVATCVVVYWILLMMFVLDA
jgi:hypothetical protein